MTDTGGHDTDQDLAGLGRSDIHFDDLQGWLGPKATAAT